jgi:cysteinyl-tRNA synthetase
VIVFDLLFRLLRHVYGAEAVTYVRNITDVDDKINKRAFERGIPIRALTEETARQFHDDIRALGVLMPEDVNEAGKPPRFVEPRATEHIDEMRLIIERLVERGAAYVAEDHVLFSVAAMDRIPSVPRYGTLSRRSVDELVAGARVDVAPYKRDPMDFVLWKPSGPEEPAWPSPAGIAAPGRPGWHIECSAMAWRHLVKAFDTRLACEDPADRAVFDIHGGGIDLVFPHHENEIAQSCCAFGIPRMANVWMHNGFLQMEGEKMSKSLGNFTTIRDLLRDWPGEVLRFNMLRTHYRQPIDWTVRGLEESEKILNRWADKLEGRDLPQVSPDAEFIGALFDDLNTPAAIARLHELFRSGGFADPQNPDPDGSFEFGPGSSGFGEGIERDEQGAVALASLRFLGFSGQRLTKERIVSAVGAAAGVSKAYGRALSDEQEREIDTLVKERCVARASKNWRESDRIRDELTARGIALKDNKDGTTSWEVAR